MSDYVEDLIKCPNPKCISNIENINSKFYIDKDKQNLLRCHYCEKEYKVEDVEIIL
jgi:aspartate carbamoyltransferase regulatory subunit